MQLHQMEYFLTVAEEGSFTRAAERLTIAQPSLSTQIARLERELGGKLFERLPRGVVLTPAGRAFQVEAQQAVLAASRARRAARATLDGNSGEIQIATVLSIAVGLLPASISAWHQLRPGVTMGLHEYRHREALQQAVAAGIGDVAIGPTPTEWRGPVVELGEEEFVIVLARDAAEATIGPRPLTDFAESEWVLYDESHGLSDFLDEICAAAGFRARGSVRTGQVEAAARLAAAGIGPALVPSNIVPPGLRASIVHLDPPLLRPLAAYGRTEFSPLVDSYVRVLRQTTRHLRRKRESAVT
ncbi:MAG: LysR family transcriptional regulator [Nocardioidaceae bacterium]|nr:LysR family transcriptional regulator [Nocardioidaceae bacterium]